MGYYTSHELNVRRNDRQKFEDDLVRRINDALKDKKIIGWALEEGELDYTGTEIWFYSYGECKWYESDTDLIEISARFPECTFCLSGEGEGFGDVWKEYFLDGDHELCDAVIPPPKRIHWD